MAWPRVPVLDVLPRGDTRDVELTLDDGATFVDGDVVRWRAEVRGLEIVKSSDPTEGGGVTFVPGESTAVASIGTADTAGVVVDSTYDSEWEITTAAGDRYTLGRARLPVRVDKVLH